MGVHYVLLHEKGDRRIRTPLHPQASERIHAWMTAAAIAADDNEAYLFRPFNKRGGTLQSKPLHDFMICHIVKKYARQAGLQVALLFCRQPVLLFIFTAHVHKSFHKL